MICTVCFMELSATGQCNCETPTLPEKTQSENHAATLETRARMSHTEAFAFARTQMEKHSVGHLKLSWMNSKTMYGQTYGFVTKVMGIRLSKPLFEHISLEHQIDTVLHEIAHALSWGHGHDSAWREVALAIGCTGRTCTPMGAEIREKISKYTGTCPNGHKQYRNAKSAKMHIVSCGKCSPVYDERFKYTWTQNF